MSLLSRCTSLKKTAAVLIEWHENNSNANYEVFGKLLKFVDPSMNASGDVIDLLTSICNVLLDNKLYLLYADFIMKCPNKFIVIHSNNSEKTPYILSSLKNAGFIEVVEYLIDHVTPTLLKTWNERYSRCEWWNNLLL
jgi:hypothetical protein